MWEEPHSFRCAAMWFFALRCVTAYLVVQLATQNPCGSHIVSSKKVAWAAHSFTCAKPDFHRLSFAIVFGTRVVRYRLKDFWHFVESLKALLRRECQSDDTP